MTHLDRIYFEITNMCNLRCSFCPPVQRKISYMPLADFSHIARQSVGLAKELCLHVYGEPLLHPEFTDILNYCDQLPITVQITTNGTQIMKYGSLLASSKSLRQINFSLQSLIDNYPLDQALSLLQDILDFVQMLLIQRPEIYINLRLWNQSDSTDSSNLWQENRALLSAIETRFEITVKRKIDVGSIKSKRIGQENQRLYLHFDSRFIWPSLELPYLGTQGRCYGMVNHIGILVDGTVIPCCLDKEGKISLGNALKSDLVTILESSRAKAMLNGFANGQLVEELCRHCPYIRRFNK